MAHTENEIGSIILNAAFRVHSALGPGLLESSYLTCLDYELNKSGLLVETQVPMPLVFDKIRMECGYRIDMMVERKVIVELKSVESLTHTHFAQLLTYLKLSGCKLGYLINFNEKYLKSGIRRIVNGSLLNHF